MALTPEAQGKVDERRRPVRPQYYDASLRRVLTIGEDLEGFLLLADGDLREEIVDRLGQANEGTPDLDALYAEALVAEADDASAMLTDFDQALSGFSTFKDRVLSSPLGLSPEVAPLIQDVQRGVGPVVEKRERIFHRLQTARVLEDLRRRTSGTEDEIAQRDSWVGVIGVYR